MFGLAAIRHHAPGPRVAEPGIMDSTAQTVYAANSEHTGVAWEGRRLGSNFEFTVASLYVKAAKTAVLLQIAPIVPIEKSITYAESDSYGPANPSSSAI